MSATSRSTSPPPDGRRRPRRGGHAPSPTGPTSPLCDPRPIHPPAPRPIVGLHLRQRPPHRPIRTVKAERTQLVEHDVTTDLPPRSFHPRLPTRQLGGSQDNEHVNEGTPADRQWAIPLATNGQDLMAADRTGRATFTARIQQSASAEPRQHQSPDRSPPARLPPIDDVHTTLPGLHEVG